MVLARLRCVRHGAGPHQRTGAAGVRWLGRAPLPLRCEREAATGGYPRQPTGHRRGRKGAFQLAPLKSVVAPAGCVFVGSGRVHRPEVPPVSGQPGGPAVAPSLPACVTRLSTPWWSRRPRKSLIA